MCTALAPARGGRPARGGPPPIIHRSAAAAVAEDLAFRAAGASASADTTAALI